MPKNRKSIGASLRWSVFSRDAFSCRYCGAQAGEDGVELVIDHVVSVVEGGDNSFDNLVASCKRCNSGKGARSLQSAPTADEVVSRIHARTTTLRQQAIAIAASIKARDRVQQAAVNLKCAAYEKDAVQMRPGEADRIARLCQSFGADRVLEWYESAAIHAVDEREAIKYVYGCVRRHEGRSASALKETTSLSPGADREAA